jgi:hypothetical protein
MNSFLNFVFFILQIQTVSLIQPTISFLILHKGLNKIIYHHLVIKIGKIKIQKKKATLVLFFFLLLIEITNVMNNIIPIIPIHHVNLKLDQLKNENKYKKKKYIRKNNFFVCLVTTTGNNSNRINSRSSW